MSSGPCDRVLAIGLDAAESSLIRRMIDDGELPAMASLLAAGGWTRVTSPTAYSDGSVWPTFYTGQPPCDHGQCARWNWAPEEMRLAYTDTSKLTPFWRQLADEGVRVGIVDVPFAPFVGLTDGFDVAEWGPHDRIVGRVRVSPQSVADDVVAAHPKHPFDDDLAAPPRSHDEVPGFLHDCIAGVTRRGDLALHLLTEVKPDFCVVVFPEAHHGGHYLWHTVEPDLDLYAGIPPVAKPDKTLADVYREMDVQVGRLVAAAAPGTAVFVFALHGMEPALGAPALHGPLLEELGMAVAGAAGSPRASVLATVKSRVPAPIKALYRRTVPLEHRSRWGEAAVQPTYDWTRTRAFALPIEHAGYIRINLAGREAQGIVRPEDYDRTCDEIEAALRAVTTVNGDPAVSEVLRPPRGAHPGGLPDLVVHYRKAAFESPARIGDAEVPPIRPLQTGQHALDGFCISNLPDVGTRFGDGADLEVSAEDLHHVLAAALNR